MGVVRVCREVCRGWVSWVYVVDGCRGCMSWVYYVVEWLCRRGCGSHEWFLDLGSDLDCHTSGFLTRLSSESDLGCRVSGF